MSETISDSLAPERVQRMSDSELVRQLARIWTDPEARVVLSGSSEFIRERIEHYGRRGYLTARERQGIVRTLFAGAVPLHRRLCAWEERHNVAPAS